MERSKKSAFSLAELMITLLILSIVLSAVMPAVNKRHAGQESVWRWVYNQSHAYFGLGSRQALLIGMSTKPVKVEDESPTGEALPDYSISDYGNKKIVDFVNNTLGDDADNEHTLTGIGDRIVINKQSANKHHSISNSHISFFTTKENSSGEMNDWHYTGRISFDESNIAIGRYTMAHVKYKNESLGLNELNTHDRTKNNTALGQFALFGLSEGYKNIAVGNAALYNNTDGYGNTAVGYQSMLDNTDGYQNSAFGLMALKNTTLGNYNTALGAHALRTQHRESYTSAIEIRGNSNTAVGFGALYQGGTVSDNTALGYRAGYSLGQFNFADSDDSDHNNVFIGDNAGLYVGAKNFSKTPVHNDNVFIGSNAGANAGYQNVNIEYNNIGNIYIGSKAGYQSGGSVESKQTSYNTVIGQQAGYSMGFSAAASNEPNIYNVLIGAGTGYNLSGNSNTYVGSKSGGADSYLNTSDNNTFLGAASGYKNENSSKNVFLGTYAGYKNETGSSNLVAGYRALGQNGGDNNTGSENVILGTESGFSNTSGGNNTFIGNKAGYSNTTGGNNVFIGNKAGFGNTTGSNQFVIANDQNNDLMKGVFKSEDNVAELTVLSSLTKIGPDADQPLLNVTAALEGNPALVAVGASLVGAGGHPLKISSNVEMNDSDLSANNITANTINGSVYPPSDKRLKNIKGDAEKGLSAVDAFKIIRYNYKNDENKREHVGIIAQDLQKIMPNSVIKRPDGFLAISLDDITFTIAKAVQELHQAVLNIAKEVKDLAVKVLTNTQKIEALEKENKDLKQQINDLDARLKKLEEAK